MHDMDAEAHHDQQEKLRLLFVGATRARRLLSISSAEPLLALLGGAADADAPAAAQPQALRQARTFADVADCHTIPDAAALESLWPLQAQELL